MPNSAEELGTIIGNTIKETKDLARSMSHPSGQDTNIIFPVEDLEVIPLTVKIRLRSVVGDSLIWGNSFFGIWGTQKWNDTVTYSFVLGHSGAGILGTIKLGSTLSDFEIERVVSYGDTFKEFFASTNFKDTDTSTSTTNTDDEEEEFDDGEVYQSDIIYKDNQTITKARATIYARTGSYTAIIDTDLAELEFNITID